MVTNKLKSNILIELDYDEIEKLMCILTATVDDDTLCEKYTQFAGDLWVDIDATQNTIHTTENESIE